MEEAIETLETNERSARDLILYHSTILASLTSLTPTSELPTVRDLTSYTDLFTWDRTKLLVLKGPTNKGKTTLACSLLPRALFVSHVDQLALYNSAKFNGIILDDMAFTQWPRTSQIHLTDTAMPRALHVRYRIANIPAGTPKILTTNSEAWEVLDVKDPAIARRVTVVHWWGYDHTPNWDWDNHFAQ